MHPLFTHPFSMKWNVTVLEVSPDGFLSPVCQKCQTELDIHQPQADDPNELLGTCGQCGSWHLIQVAPGGSEALVLNLPGVEFVRETLAQARKEAARKKPSAPKGPTARRPKNGVKLGSEGHSG